MLNRKSTVRLSAVVSAAVALVIVSSAFFAPGLSAAPVSRAAAPAAQPSAETILYSFETGTEGWGPQLDKPNIGTVAETTAFATEGTHGLQINATYEGWFGTRFSAIQDWSGNNRLRWDLQTLSAGTSRNVAIEIGPVGAADWCQLANWPWINADTTATIEIDLTGEFVCYPAGGGSPVTRTIDLTQVSGMYVYAKTGTFYVDYARLDQYTAPTATPTNVRPTPENTPTPQPTPTLMPGHRQDFVGRNGTQFVYQGKPFRAAGTNNYYLMYKSHNEVDWVLETAAVNNFKVMRTWGFLDIGYEGEGGDSDGVYFQYFDGRAPRVNTGPDGLQRLDYVIAKAGEAGVKLIIPFTNNWEAFGGMDQYVKWLNEIQPGANRHDLFYTDPTIKGWYQNWINTLLNRVNTITGVAYKDDPTIMAWELANEPRCKGGIFPSSAACTTDTITNWAGEMSGYVKSIDPNHLVAVGDEGFYCIQGAADWAHNCTSQEGIDTIALTSLPTIDYMSFHLYPQDWGFAANSAAWGEQYIREHVRDANRLGKPVLMGEFGFKDESADLAVRQQVYKAWTDAFLQEGGDVSLFWILSSYLDNGTLYPDYDKYTVYCPSVVCTLLYGHANQMAGIPTRVLFSFERGTEGWGPADWAPNGSVAQTTDWATHLTHSLAITATDPGSWFGLQGDASLNFSRAEVLKLDVQTGAAGGLKNVAFKSGAAGIWCELPGWNLLTTNNTSQTVAIDLTARFMCGNVMQYVNLQQVRGLYLYFDPGSYRVDHVRVEGKAVAANTLYLPLILKNGPVPGVPTATPTGPTPTHTATPTATATASPFPTWPPDMSTLLYSFETGTEGWGSASWEQAGTVAQSTEHATQGTHSLQVNATGGWMVAEPSPALDFTGKTKLSIDIWSPSATQVKVSLSTSSAFTWQETGMISLNAGQNTVTVDLANLSGVPVGNPNDVRRIGVYYSAGTYYQDNVRVE